MHEKIEKEAKFYVRDLKKIEQQIKAFGGVIVQPRVFESNLRFDTSKGELSASYQVLRLRQDMRARLTFKGPADPNSEVSARLEYEVEISDLATGRHILEALGYQVITIYEKYRTSYALDDVEISLDEMPFGSFMEIEGADTQHIQAMAGKLNLKWENRSALSYLRIFSQVKEQLDLSMRNLTFDNFLEVEIKPKHLHLTYAD